MQLQASLDDSLLEPRQARPPSRRPRSDDHRPPGARPGCSAPPTSASSSSRPARRRSPRRRTARSTLGQPELDVAAARRRPEIRTIARRRRALPRRRRARRRAARRWSWPSRSSRRRRVLEQARHGDAALRRWPASSAPGSAGWAVARNGLRPVRRLTAAVEEIARTEDLAPLPVEGDDEIARLATAFNPMLAALAASRDRQRRLVADAGHELRTPLTSLRTNLDLLTQADDDRRAAAGGSRPSCSTTSAPRSRSSPRSSATSSSSPATSRPPPRGRALSTSPRWSSARWRGCAAGRRASTSTSPRAVVGGRRGGGARARGHQPARQRREVEPARRHGHGPAGGRRADRRRPGPGHPSADLPHVFERFYRSDESRTMPGSGLGLAIVHQVVERHGGVVTRSARRRAGWHVAAGHRCGLPGRRRAAGCPGPAEAGRVTARHRGVVDPAATCVEAVSGASPTTAPSARGGSGHPPTAAVRRWPLVHGSSVAAPGARHVGRATGSAPSDTSTDSGPPVRCTSRSRPPWAPDVRPESAVTGRSETVGPGRRASSRRGRSLQLRPAEPYARAVPGYPVDAGPHAARRAGRARTSASTGSSTIRSTSTGADDAEVVLQPDAAS